MLLYCSSSKLVFELRYQSESESHTPTAIMARSHARSVTLRLILLRPILLRPILWSTGPVFKRRSYGFSPFIQPNVAL